MRKLGGVYTLKDGDKEASNTHHEKVPPVFTRSIVAQGKYDYIRGKTRRKYECIFCEVLKGNPELETHPLYEDDDFYCTLNLYPYNAGHLLVLPKKHITSLLEFSSEDLTRLFSLVQACEKILKKSLKPSGFNIGVNEGPNSGQSITHFHVHIVPRFPNELGFMDTVGATRTVPLTIDQVQEILLPKFKKIECKNETYEWGG